MLFFLPLIAGDGAGARVRQSRPEVDLPAGVSPQPLQAGSRVRPGEARHPHTQASGGCQACPEPRTLPRERAVLKHSRQFMFIFPQMPKRLRAYPGRLQEIELFPVIGSLLFLLRNHTYAAWKMYLSCLEKMNKSAMRGLR